MINSRRQFLQTSGAGFGYLAFSALAHADSQRALAVKEPHFTPKAKRIIFLCMKCAPSHVDTFDYKPALTAASGKDGRVPGSKLKGSQWKFRPQGKSGLQISELLPHLSKHVDDLCIFNSMHTDVPAHPPSFINLHTGSTQFVRPSLGAWTLYGLGSVNQNLPGFVTIAPPSLFGGAQNYGSSFLPAAYQGTRIGVPRTARPADHLRSSNACRKQSGATFNASLVVLRDLGRLPEFGEFFANERVELERVIWWQGVDAD